MIVNVNDTEEITRDINSLIKKAATFLQKKMTASSNEYNPSTNIDVEISNYLSDNLANILNIPVISEEGKNQHELLKGDYVWVIDPLDGTLNVLTNNVPFCISVTLLDVNKVQALLSCNYVPYNNDLFFAIRERGAFLNESRITSNKYAQKIISYALPGDTINNIDLHTDHFKAILKEGFITRQGGSAIYDILMTALGRYHGFYEFGLFLWDFVGPDLVATECGCKSFFRKSTRHGDNELKYDYLVSNNRDSLYTLKHILNI